MKKCRFAALFNKFRGYFTHRPRIKMKKTRCFKVNKFNILAQAPFIKVNKFYFRG